MARYTYSRSPAHARRQLAKVQAQLDAWRAVDCTGSWRKAADKARALAALEVQEARYLAILAPEPVVRFRVPF